MSASTGAVEAAGTGGAGRGSEVGDSTWGIATKDGQAVDAGIDAATATKGSSRALVLLVARGVGLTGWHASGVGLPPALRALALQ